MAAAVYRFQLTGFPTAEFLTRQVGGALLVLGNIAPNIYVDITADTTQLADLQEIMANMGYATLTATNPTITVAQQAAQATSVTVTTPTATITTAQTLVYVDTTANAVALTLPDPALVNAPIVIKDIGGNLSANNLTLVRFGAEKIENLAATKTFQSNFGEWTLQSDGTNWWLK